MPKPAWTEPETENPYVLFNSSEFIFAFLPLTVAGFFLLGKLARVYALSWLIFASIFFYAWWNLSNVFIIGFSLLLNYLIATAILRLHASPDRAALRRGVLICGIAFNILFLGYFKYVNFLRGAFNDLAGTEFAFSDVILPLGISFITFQKIAFLIDVNARQVKDFRFREFCLFILFFPQLIAGPIVHFRETMPQFRSGSGRFDATLLSLGLTLFSFGLFKKVVLADGVAGYVSPIYDLAVSGGAVSLFSAWAAAIGFTLQIYFDFSGYSDMALGLALCFGIRLPVNFDSPLKATNIIDFWLRWHITLTRFLTAYVYNPLALWLTRRRLSQGLPLLGRKASTGAFLQLLAAPTVFTMFISGLWHGAGYLFICWGLVHGVYLAINHAWRIWIPRVWTDQQSYERVMRPVGFLLTFVAVATAMVLFRSTTVDGALEILSGMVGLNGVSLPRTLLEPLGILEALSPYILIDEGGAREFVLRHLWIIGLLGIVFFLPNSLQITARFEPALDHDARPAHTDSRVGILQWRPALSWAVCTSTLVLIAVMRLDLESEFLYWQF